MFDQPQHGPRKILIVNPGDVLLAVSRLSAESEPDQSQQHIERRARIGIHDNRGTHQHLARQWRGRLIQRALPFRRDIDAEAPGVRRIWFRAANDPSSFVVGRVIAMRIDRGRACLQPDPWRLPGLSNRVTNNLS